MTKKEALENLLSRSSADLYQGTHDAAHDFPLRDGCSSGIRSVTNQDLILVFDDVTIVMPECVMWYLNNKGKLVGLDENWRPPQEVIDRIMRGGNVRFANNTILDLGKPVNACGFLRLWGGKIVDTQGGDRNLEGGQCPIAQFAPSPDGFVERVSALLNASRAGEKSFELTPAPGYENTDRLFEPRVSWKENVTKGAYELLGAHGLDASGMLHGDACRLAKGLRPAFYHLFETAFFATDERVICCDVRYLWRTSRFVSVEALRDGLADAARDGLGVNAMTFPGCPGFLVFVGSDATKLRSLGASIMEIDFDGPMTLRQQVSLAIGAPVESVEITTQESGCAIRIEGVAYGTDPVLREIYKKPLCERFRLCQSSEGADWELVFSAPTDEIPNVFAAITTREAGLAVAGIKQVTSAALTVPVRGAACRS